MYPPKNPSGRNVIRPIICPPKLEDTLLMPVGYPVANNPTAMIPKNPHTPCTATAPTASSTLHRFSIRPPA